MDKSRVAVSTLNISHCPIRQPPRWSSIRNSGVYPDDYPDIVGRDNQSDANEFFVDSDIYLLNRIVALENSVGGPGNLNYEAEAPITVVQEDDKVTHGFDISILPDHTRHNPLLDRKNYRGTLNRSATREGAFTFRSYRSC